MTARTHPLGEELRPLVAPLQRQLQEIDGQVQQIVRAYLVGQGVRGRIACNLADWTYTREDDDGH